MRDPSRARWRPERRPFRSKRQPPPHLRLVRGQLFHKGVDITRGTRYLAVCFVDGHDPEVQDLSSSKGDHGLWEKNTATYHR